MKKVFSLDEYFVSHQQRLYFYDVLIKQSKLTKESLLKELNISYTSYSRIKYSSTKINIEIFRKLNRFFGINELDNKRQREYEKILNNILKKIYYKGEGLSDYLPIVEKCVLDHNYLEPLFKIIGMLIKLSSNSIYKSFIEDVRTTYEEVKFFKGNYLLSPFKEIFTIVEIILNGNKQSPFIKIDSYSSEVLGLIYYAYCSNAYLSKKYDLALYYANECKKNLLQDFNFKRLLAINLTYFSCLNIIGEYYKCAEESYKQLAYLRESNIADNYIFLTTIHYYTAYLGLEKYSDLMDIINENKILNSSDIMFLLIAAKNCDENKYKQAILQYNEMKDKFNDKQKFYVSMIIEYLDSKAKSSIKKKIIDSELNESLKMIILKL